jgi:hypothetical protein
VLVSAGEARPEGFAAVSGQLVEVDRSPADRNISVAVVPVTSGPVPWLQPVSLDLNVSPSQRARMGA